MKSRHGMNPTTKLVLGMAASAAVGAVIGMLLAPEKGKDLQKRLASTSKDWLHELSALLDLGKDAVNKMKAEGADAVQEVESNLKEISKN